MNTQYLEKLFCLDGKKAVVTGASSGLGRAIAVSLASFGAEVALLGRSIEGLKTTKDVILEGGGVCESYQVDITDTKAQDRFFADYLKNNGNQLDIFIANAGINIRAEIPDTDMDDVKRLLDTDYMGTLYSLIQTSNIMKQQRSGNIVIITSVNALSPLMNQAIYSSVKAAMENIMRSMAGSLASYGVRVNSCAPGCIRTSINNHIFSVDTYRTAKEAQIPLNRIGNPEDIGGVVAAMVSDAFSFMTGSTILVDGGELMRPKMNQPTQDSPQY